ncbi:hypothetical protein [Streptomyces harbinensis]
MASSKTRANVARVAAAAIFAAGASLAVVGTANASGAKTEKDDSLISQDLIGGITAGVTEGSSDGGGDDEGSDQGASDEGADQGGDQGGSENEGADQGGDQGGSENEGADQGGDQGGSENEGADQGGDQGGSENEGADQGGDQGGSENEGADQGSSDGPGPGVSEGSTGPGPQTEGGTSPIEQNPPTEDITETVPDTTTPAGETPNGDRGELAETGASGGEALLIIGAATMIAGGVAFRYLPRLVNKGAAAA